MTESVELIALRAENRNLRKEVLRLQQYVDGQANHTLNIILDVHSAGAAQAAVDTYDEEYFDTLPYSQSIKRMLVQEFLLCLRPYPYVDASSIVDLERKYAE